MLIIPDLIGGRRITLPRWLPTPDRRPQLTADLVQGGLDMLAAGEIGDNVAWGAAVERVTRAALAWRELHERAREDGEGCYGI